MMTVPSPRWEYYQYTAFTKTKERVLGYASEVTDKLGSYPISSTFRLLHEMQLFSLGILLLGLIFDIMLIQFIIISVLLIYSLLMITIETKTFDIGVMRMLGLNSGGFVSMIFIQAVMFVLPSLVCAFACVIPCLWYIYDKLESEKLGWTPNILPSFGAVM